MPEEQEYVVWFTAHQSWTKKLTVEASSPEEAIELVKEGEGEEFYSDLISTESTDSYNAQTAEEYYKLSPYRR